MAPADDPATMPGAAFARLGDSLINALPPAFLLLVLMNIVFLATVLWFENHQTEQRMALAMKLLDACPVYAQSLQNSGQQHRPNQGADN